MKCEFEEKQYETLMNMSLFTVRNIYVPGQVYEKMVGIDSAGNIDNEYIKCLFGLWPVGIELCKLFVKPENLPQFKCNIFLQYKRPEFITTAKGSEYKFWGKPYYRYSLTPHQQITLEDLERRVKKMAIVAYACPTYYTYEALFSSQARNKIIEESNFVSPSLLSGHHVYTFLKSGKKGKAFSEVEEIESIDLYEEIHRLTNESLEFRNNFEFINALYKEIYELSINDTIIRDIYSKLINNLFFGEESSHDEYYKQVLFIKLYMFIKGISWSIVI